MVFLLSVYLCFYLSAVFKYFLHHCQSVNKQISCDQISVRLPDVVTNTCCWNQTGNKRHKSQSCHTCWLIRSLKSLTQLSRHGQMCFFTGSITPTSVPLRPLEKSGGKKLEVFVKSDFLFVRNFTLVSLFQTVQTLSVNIWPFGCAAWLSGRADTPCIGVSSFLPLQLLVIIGHKTF